MFERNDYAFDCCKDGNKDQNCREIIENLWMKSNDKQILIYKLKIT